MTTARRIIVDWGTSNFRAYRFAASGEIAETHQAACGILSVENGQFEAVLLREIGHWITPQSEICLSGMITSRNGWLETPYIEAPATLPDIKEKARASELKNGARLLFLPGICLRSPTPDVMRGEEIQVFGTVAPNENATLILPGTHSKWVRVEAGRLASFRTFMTGEVFAMLKAHSILGRLIPAGPATLNIDAFLNGVRRANDVASAGLLHEIFTTRSGVLLDQLKPPAIAETLSGLVIGAEIAGGVALGWADRPLVLVGEAALCERYSLALEALGFSARLGPPQATVEGFRRLAAL
jgi:2-dehydro-3-deoxygalactonokinase